MSLEAVVDSAAQVVSGALVKPRFFEVVRTPPYLGRTFAPDDYRRGNRNVAILCHQFWQNALKGDPGAIGRKISLSSQEYTIIGVMPPAFEAPGGAQILVPRGE